ncbi:hypothetical protein IKQ26_01295 [bacterium]|nr:hypothetical protein [bacterium]
MKISFKSKIPVSECQVYDRQNKTFIPATLYEFDCRDYSDLQHFKHNVYKWTYMPGFISNMRIKFMHLCHNTGDRRVLDANKFYSLELPDNRIVGFCETVDFRNSTNVYYLETDGERRYKYAGQSILASLSKQMLNSKVNQEMTVNAPARSARNFYIDKCGFDIRGEKALYLDRKGMSDFVQTFEERTRKPIVNLLG